MPSVPLDRGVTVGRLSPPCASVAPLVSGVITLPVSRVVLRTKGVKTAEALRTVSVSWWAFGGGW